MTAAILDDIDSFQAFAETEEDHQQKHAGASIAEKQDMAHNLAGHQKRRARGRAKSREAEPPKKRPRQKRAQSMRRTLLKRKREEKETAEFAGEPSKAKRKESPSKKALRVAAEKRKKGKKGVAKTVETAARLERTAHQRAQDKIDQQRRDATRRRRRATVVSIGKKKSRPKFSKKIEEMAANRLENAFAKYWELHGKEKWRTHKKSEKHASEAVKDAAEDRTDRAFARAPKPFNEQEAFALLQEVIEGLRGKGRRELSVKADRKDKIRYNAKRASNMLDNLNYQASRTQDARKLVRIQLKMRMLRDAYADVWADVERKKPPPPPKAARPGGDKPFEIMGVDRQAVKIKRYQEMKATFRAHLDKKAGENSALMDLSKPHKVSLSRHLIQSYNRIKLAGTKTDEEFANAVMDALAPDTFTATASQEAALRTLMHAFVKSQHGSRRKAPQLNQRTLDLAANLQATEATAEAIAGMPPATVPEEPTLNDAVDSATIAIEDSVRTCGKAVSKSVHERQKSVSEVHQGARTSVDIAPISLVSGDASPAHVAAESAPQYATAIAPGLAGYGEFAKIRTRFMADLKSGKYSQMDGARLKNELIKLHKKAVELGEWMKKLEVDVSDQKEKLRAEYVTEALIFSDTVKAFRSKLTKTKPAHENRDLPRKRRRVQEVEHTPDDVVVAESDAGLQKGVVVGVDSGGTTVKFDDGTTKTFRAGAGVHKFKYTVSADKWSAKVTMHGGKLHEVLGEEGDQLVVRLPSGDGKEFRIPRKGAAGIADVSSAKPEHPLRTTLNRIKQGQSTAAPMYGDVVKFLLNGKTTFGINSPPKKGEEIADGSINVYLPRQRKFAVVSSWEVKDRKWVHKNKPEYAYGSDVFSEKMMPKEFEYIAEATGVPIASMMSQYKADYKAPAPPPMPMQDLVSQVADVVRDSGDILDHGRVPNLPRPPGLVVSFPATPGTQFLAQKATITGKMRRLEVFHSKEYVPVTAAQMKHAMTYRTPQRLAAASKALKRDGTASAVLQFISVCNGHEIRIRDHIIKARASLRRVVPELQAKRSAELVRAEAKIKELTATSERAKKVLQRHVLAQTKKAQSDRVVASAINDRRRRQAAGSHANNEDLHLAQSRNLARHDHVQHMRATVLQHQQAHLVGVAKATMENLTAKLGGLSALSLRKLNWAVSNFPADMVRFTQLNVQPQQLLLLVDQGIKQLEHQYAAAVHGAGGAAAIMQQAMGRQPNLSASAGNPNISRVNRVPRKKGLTANNLPSPRARPKPPAPVPAPFTPASVAAQMDDQKDQTIRHKSHNVFTNALATSAKQPLQGLTSPHVPPTPTPIKPRKEAHGDRSDVEKKGADHAMLKGHTAFANKLHPAEDRRVPVNLLPIPGGWGRSGRPKARSQPRAQGARRRRGDRQPRTGTISAPRSTITRHTLPEVRHTLGPVADRRVLFPKQVAVVTGRQRQLEARSGIPLSKRVAPATSKWYFKHVKVKQTGDTVHHSIARPMPGKTMDETAAAVLDKAPPGTSLVDEDDVKTADDIPSMFGKAFAATGNLNKAWDNEVKSRRSKSLVRVRRRRARGAPRGLSVTAPLPSRPSSSKPTATTGAAQIQRSSVNMSLGELELDYGDDDGVHDDQKTATPTTQDISAFLAEGQRWLSQTLQRNRGHHSAEHAAVSSNQDSFGVQSPAKFRGLSSRQRKANAAHVHHARRSLSRTRADAPHVVVPEISQRQKNELEILATTGDDGMAVAIAQDIAIDHGVMPTTATSIPSMLLDYDGSPAGDLKHTADALRSWAAHRLKTQHGRPITQDDYDQIHDGFQRANSSNDRQHVYFHGERQFGPQAMADIVAHYNANTTDNVNILNFYPSQGVRIDEHGNPILRGTKFEMRAGGKKGLERLNTAIQTILSGVKVENADEVPGLTVMMDIYRLITEEDFTAGELMRARDGVSPSHEQIAEYMDELDEMRDDVYLTTYTKANPFEQVLRQDVENAANRLHRRRPRAFMPPPLKSQVPPPTAADIKQEGDNYYVTLKDGREAHAGDYEQAKIIYIRDRRFGDVTTDANQDVTNPDLIAEFEQIRRQ